MSTPRTIASLATAPVVDASTLDVGSMRDFMLTHGPQIVVVVCLAQLCAVALRALLIRVGLGKTPSQLTKMEESARRRSTQLAFVQTAGVIAIWLMAGLTIMAMLRINLAPILTGAGVLGVVVGLGAQGLVRDFVRGWQLLTEDRVRVGDIVQVGTITGTVEHLDLRSLTMRGFDGVAHLIPTGTIDTISNLTYQFSQVVLDVPASYDDEPDKVIALLKQITSELEADGTWKEFLLESPRVLGLQEFGASAITYRVTFKVRASWQWAIARELRRRLWYAFRDSGLRFPYEHLSISVEGAKAMAMDDAPPLK
ncbi:MAG: mechanosensitive ion channel domain-containing protein [bacterium]